MKIVLATLFFASLTFIACKSTKNVSSPNIKISKTGIIIPTTIQLDAIMATNPTATIEELEAGHKIYIGVCTDCHRAKSIYKRDLIKWPDIIKFMAKKSKLTVLEKENLTKYIMAIKATQPTPKK